MPTNHQDNEHRPVLGIDLGTTYSAIARWDGRGASVYQLQNGDKTLASVLYYQGNSQQPFVVGKVARSQAVREPERFVDGVKRHMDDSAYRVNFDGHSYSAIDLSAEILKRLYQDVAIKYPTANFSSRGTVVTVPYYFKKHQCKNTTKAAELAQINCISLLPEPIAASLSYVWKRLNEHPEQEYRENVLVFDLGGGTFDLTLFTLEQTVKAVDFRVLATSGSDRLGGMDFDECLKELILVRSGLSLSGLSEKMLRPANNKLNQAAIEAKHALSWSDKTEVLIPDLIPGSNVEITITRNEFEKSIKSYLDKISDIVESLWSKAGFNSKHLDRVILAGGSTRIPCIQLLLSDLFGENKIHTYLDPDLCVAEGAAIYAAYLDDRQSMSKVFHREFNFLPRTCHALGVLISSQEVDIIVPANTPLPCQKSKTYTFKENSNTINLYVYEGSSKQLKDNTKVGYFSLPESVDPSKHVKITFNVTSEQILLVIVEIDGRSYSQKFEII